jgi:hypothetical protein
MQVNRDDDGNYWIYVIASWPSKKENEDFI